jgi:aminopeptidase N
MVPRPRRSAAGRAAWFPAMIIVASARLFGPPCPADTYPRQPGIDVVHYTFRLTLRDETDEITGETDVELRFLQDGLEAFDLDLASARSGKGMTIASVTSRRAAVAFEHKDDRVRVSLDRPHKAGDRDLYTVAYSGVPSAGLRIGKNRHGERTFFSDNWPDKARRWLPTVDHPYDKATSELFVTAPAHYQVVANGLLEEETDLGDGRRLTHWRQSVPIASWLTALGVAHFTSHHARAVRGVPLETWVYHQDRDAVMPALENAARRVLEFYAEQIGPYPYEKLGSVQAAGVEGGMELASAIFYGERSVHRGDVTGLVAHEIAHQWFGDAVTERDWDDVWLSEGFATYLALLFLEHDRGRDAFVAGLKRSQSAVFVTEDRNPGLAVIHDNLADMRRVLNGLVYQKGGWVLHMLRARLGRETFWSGIREYYRRHRDSNASTDDFRRAMEQVSGEDLAWFFRQWLYRPGSPSLEGSWTHRPAEHRIEIALHQTQASEPYRLPIEIGVLTEGASEPRIEKIELTGREHQFVVSAEKPPVSVTLDPNCWALCRTKFGPRPTDGKK